MRSNRTLQYLAALSMVASLFALAGRAEAHALGAECKLNGNKVDVEAYYDDDTAARDAKVRVEDSDKKVITEGRTDKAGKWSFPRPKAGRYLVIVDAGAGHRTQVKITIHEGEGSASASSSQSKCDDCECCEADKGTPTGSSESISDGPSRDDFTSWPWLRIGIGFTVIAGLGGAFWVSQKINGARRNAVVNGGTQSNGEQH